MINRVIFLVLIIIWGKKFWIIFALNGYNNFMNDEKV